MSLVKSQHKQLVLSRDHFSNYLKQHDEKTLFLQTAFIEVHILTMIKESKFNWCSSHKLCIMLLLLLFSLKEDLINKWLFPVCSGGYFEAPIYRRIYQLNLFNLT